MSLNCIYCGGRGGWYEPDEGTWVGCPCQRVKVTTEHCLMDEFIREQAKLHPNMRSAGALLVCNCEKCRRSRGTL
jgi:hypothetical protein